MPDDLIDRIITRVHDRQERWKTTLEPVLPTPEWVNETAIIGKFSIATLETKRRMILEPVCISLDHSKETPSTLARDYLMVTYKKGPPITKEQSEVISETASAHPLYVNPCRFHEAWYIDIEACYWNTMLVAGWAVDYYPGKWLGLTRPPDDFPWPKNKIARNCLVSIGMMGEVPLWKDGEWTTIRTGNVLRNSQLFCLINDTLNAIGHAAMRAGAVYVNTDGYIATSEKAMREIVGIITDWGFQARIKAHGSGMVNGPGSYIIGKTRTERIMRQDDPMYSIREVPYARWLQERIAWAFSLRQEE